MHFRNNGVSVLQEEAVKTYTRAIEDLDAGKLPDWEQLPVRHSIQFSGPNLAFICRSHHTADDASILINTQYAGRD